MSESNHNLIKQLQASQSDRIRLFSDGQCRSVIGQSSTYFGTQLPLLVDILDRGGAGLSRACGFLLLFEVGDEGRDTASQSGHPVVHNEEEGTR